MGYPVVHSNHQPNDVLLLGRDTAKFGKNSSFDTALGLLTLACIPTALTTTLTLATLKIEVGSLALGLVNGSMHFYLPL